jgi:hypothetical protein
MVKYCERSAKTPVSDLVIETMVWGDALVTACTQVHYLKAELVLRKPGFFSHPLRQQLFTTV